LGGTRNFTLPTGQQERIPLRFELPAILAPGTYAIRVQARFGSGQVQEDTFAVHVLTPAPTPTVSPKLALFDPKGETAALLNGLGISSQTVSADGDLSSYDILVIGKSALTLDGQAPDLSHVRDGLKVLVFEQTSEVLEQRLGFRVEEYGLRQVVPRIAGHPALSGLSIENLTDWRGSATLLPPLLKYELRPRYGPTVQWCDIPVTRLWRCGNRGNVASVLIEKPAQGDFLPIVDGGFS